VAGLALSLAIVALASCGDDEEQACVEDLTTDCNPLYSPTYDQVFTRTLVPTCAQPGTACHASEGAKGGLVFEDADESYALLLGEVGEARVLAGDAACSPLVIRIESSESSVVMPPGAPLDAAERCAIVQWIANGAER
jgi:hypothetical protein